MTTIKEMITSDNYSQIKHDSEIYMADFIRLTDCKHGIYGQYNITESGISAKDFDNAYDMASSDDVPILSDFKRSAKLSFPTTALTLVEWVKNQGMEFTLPNSFVTSVTDSANNAIEALNKDKNVDLKLPQSIITAYKLSNSRADDLTAVINLAREKAVDSLDTSSVWASLVALCNTTPPPPPLIAHAGDEGIKYSANGDTLFFTKKNLADRMRRIKKY